MVMSDETGRGGPVLRSRPESSDNNLVWCHYPIRTYFTVMVTVAIRDGVYAT